MIDKHLELRDRTKKFSFRILHLFKALPHTSDADVIGKQLLRCSTSVAANYRAVGRCRTKAEFANKLRIVLEEADESVYWLECIREAKLFRPDLLDPLVKEANELVCIFSASLRTVTD
jgi:four helix bundle protein